MDSDKESNVEQETENTEAEESAEVSPPTPQAEPSLVPAEVAQNLQSKAQRYQNIVEAQQAELEEKNQLLVRLQSEQRKSLLSQYGDDPNVQGMLQKMEQLDTEAAKVAAERQRLLPLRQLADAQMLAEKFGCNPDDLMEAQSFAEMEGMAKVLGKTKTVSQKPDTKKQPAIPHIPDSGVTSARPKSDFESIEDAYAKGDVSFKEYQAARKEKGLAT